MKNLIKILAAIVMTLTIAPSVMAHHIIDVSVQIDCEGYTATVTANVFGGHRLVVDINDNIVLDEVVDGPDHNITRTFTGDDIDVAIESTIYKPNGKKEDRQFRHIVLEKSCATPTPTPTPTPNPTPTPQITPTPTPNVTPNPTPTPEITLPPTSTVDSGSDSDSGMIIATIIALLITAGIGATMMTRRLR